MDFANGTTKHKLDFREKLNNESAPITLKRRKPRRHREHRVTQSIVNQHYKLSES
jgi:hypothetical protein